MKIQMKKKVSQMSHKPIQVTMKETNYSKKITAGRIIGLQNLLP